MDHIPLLFGGVQGVNQGQLPGALFSSRGLVKRNVANLQDTEVEFALSLGARHCALIRLRCRDELQRLGSNRVEHCKREVVPVDDDSKVVPVLGGEWGRE